MCAIALTAVFQSSVLVYLRLGLNGSSPIFSPQDNPASFHKSPLTRYLQIYLDKYLNIYII